MKYKVAKWTQPHVEDAAYLSILKETRITRRRLSFDVLALNILFFFLVELRGNIAQIP